MCGESVCVDRIAMTAIKAYEDVWQRCDELSHLYAYLSKQVTSVYSLDDLLRAEWAMRISALDLFVHELTAQRMLEIFRGTRPPTPAFHRFQLPYETVHRIRQAPSPADAASAFDLEVRTQLSRKTFQAPDDIALALRHCSEIELWQEIALKLGANQSEKSDKAKFLKEIYLCSCSGEIRLCMKVICNLNSRERRGLSLNPILHTSRLG